MMGKIEFDERGLLVNGKPRRLIVRDGFGSVLGGEHSEIDLTGVANANASVVAEAVVEEQCNLGHWHPIQHHPLAQWPLA